MMKRLIVILAGLLLWASCACAQMTFPGGGIGSAGAPTLVTICPPSTVTGSTLTLNNNLPVQTESGAFTVSCGIGYQVTISASAAANIPVTAGLLAFVKNLPTSTAPLVLTPVSGQIDGQATVNLWPGQMALVWSDGTNVQTDLNSRGQPCNMGYVSGRWVSGCGATGAAGSVTGGGGNVTCAPFIVGWPGATFKAIGGVALTTDTTSTGFIWLGLYTNAGGAPGAKIDDIGGTAITAPGANNTAFSASLANGTDALAPAQYWTCAATPSTTLIMTGISLSSAYLMSSTTINHAIGANNAGVAGLQCTAGSTGCGPTWASAAPYTGAANFTSPVPTWGERSSGAAPNLALQVQ